MAVSDITGQRFGRAVAIKRVAKPVGYKTRCAYWLCLCDCGQEFTARGSSLRYGTCQSCGCLCRDRVIETHSKDNHHVFMTDIFGQYSGGARKRNLSFELTLEDFEDLLFRNCSYCGSPPQNKWTHRYDPKREQIFWNGLDRIDPERGYHRDNVTTACFCCNRAKSNMSNTEWQSWLSQLVAFRSLLPAKAA